MMVQGIAIYERRCGEMFFDSYGLLSWICAKTFFMYESLQLIESNAPAVDGKQYDIIEDENTGLLYYTKL